MLLYLSTFAICVGIRKRNKLEKKMLNNSDPRTFPKETVGMIPCHVLSDRDENVPTFSSKFLLLPIFQSFLKKLYTIKGNICII